MKLTGKAKEDFEGWVISAYKTEGFRPNKDGYYQVNENESWVIDFYDTPDSMKYGVYEDFAESVGFIIEILYYELSGVFYFEINKIDFEDEDLGDRPTTRINAIEKFNELLNKKLAS